MEAWCLAHAGAALAGKPDDHTGQDTSTQLDTTAWHAHSGSPAESGDGQQLDGCGLEPAAAAALAQCISTLDGISPSAQAQLLEEVGRLTHAAAGAPALSADASTASGDGAAGFGFAPLPAATPLPGATGDAGSGYFPHAAAAAASDDEGAWQRGGARRPPSRGASLGSAFASLAHQAAAAGAQAGPGCSLAAPRRSLCTYKTKALASVAGAMRAGPIGSTLRWLGDMYRSSSGSLVDVLLSEAARAESGLLTAALPRSDSLPDLRLAGSGAAAASDLPELASLAELDMTLAELPSFGLLGSATGLSLLQQQPAPAPAPAAPSADAAAPAAPAAQPEPQPCAPEAAASTVVERVLAAAAAGGDAPGADALAPPPAAGGRSLGRPASFNARTAEALFVASHPMEVRRAPSSPDCAGPGAAALVAPGSHPALRPPQLLPPSQMILLSSTISAPAAAEPSLQLAPGALAAHHSAAPALGGGARASAFAGHRADAPLAGLGAAPAPAGDAQHGLLAQQLFPQPAAHGVPRMERQDTFDVLLRQVDAELMAEAGMLRQCAAFEAGLDALQAGADSAAAAFAAAAAAAPAPPAQAQARRAPRAHKRRSVFQSVPALPDGGAGAAAPGFLSAWPEGPLPAASPFNMPALADAAGLPLLTGIDLAAAGLAAAMDVGEAAAAEHGDEHGAASARYSRVITCKTYLKRLNITQPMAEHLMPYHDLNKPSGAAAAAAAGRRGDESPKRPGSSYELLFKEDLAVVDATSGTRYRVTYEGVCCNAQKHLRLTSGWRDFIRARGVAVGDTIVFERRGDERYTLYATVIKAGAGGGGDEAPAPKRRRTSRPRE